ncbi:MAG: hypothetical protein JWM34_1602 [Ilumatobacteraceae bacterium]|nr:hypothetical protein [Ilumatobacteraceae bacterium]
MTAVAIVIGVALVVGVVALFGLTRKHPENAAGHASPDRTGSAMMHGDSDDRPAGPGAEDEFVSGPGSIGPGPSAENLPWPQDREQPNQ